MWLKSYLLKLPKLNSIPIHSWPTGVWLPSPTSLEGARAGSARSLTQVFSKKCLKRKIIKCFQIIVHVLKVWGNWLGYPISFSTPSWPPSWAGWRPGLLELFLDGSTKNTPNQLAGSTKLPLFKKYPMKSKCGNKNFFNASWWILNGKKADTFYYIFPWLVSWHSWPDIVPDFLFDIISKCPYSYR